MNGVGWRVWVGTFLAAALAGGCGDDQAVQTMPGDQVAAIAERHLKAQHAKISRGTMSCPDLVIRVGATTRCTRIATLSAGRWVRLLGTVEVTDVRGGGKLHVRMDPHAVEYGVRGTYLESLAKKRVTRLEGRKPDKVECGDLVAQQGRVVVCPVAVGDRKGTVSFKVTDIDPATYDIDYRLEIGRFRDS